jgi:dihydroorotate dehydrogenase (fumarate)
MRDLSTNYMGLKLKNPIVVSSSGLTNSVSKIEKLVEAGAGAVVLKSLFEEQINQEINQEIYKSGSLDYPEALDYVQGYVHNNKVADYLDLIKQAKAKVDVPIIASINCYSAFEWIEFAKQIQSAGADAIELNVFVVPTDKNQTAEECEKVYFDVIENVSKGVKIPVAMKIGPYFSNLVGFANRLSVSGAKGLVLFNRFYEPDIDVHNLKVTSAEVFSNSSDLKRSLRWVSIVSSKVPAIHISASTGVHDAEGIIKQLLVGATTVQVCSAIYKSGPSLIRKMLDDLEFWMAGKGFSSIKDFRGSMNYATIPEPQVFERAQFMKYFSSLE